MLERLRPAVRVNERLQTRRIRLGVRWTEDRAASEVDRGGDADVGDSAAAAAAAAAGRVRLRELPVVRNLAPLTLSPRMAPLSPLPPRRRRCRRGGGLALR